jgi:hypothetical protein
LAALLVRLVLTALVAAALLARLVLGTLVTAALLAALPGLLVLLARLLLATLVGIIGLVHVFAPLFHAWTNV